MTGDFRRHVRVAVAVAAHPGGEANRHKVDRQAIAQIFFQLFVQLAQVVGYPFPQAVFHHRKAPLGFVDRAWAMLTNFIGVPGLGNQLAQAAHKLVTFVVGDVFVIQLLQTVVHFHHFVDQRTTGDFGWVCGQHQLQRKGFHRFFDGRFVEVGLVFEFTKGAGNDFRVAGRFAFWRNAVVLLSGVCQVQELAEGAGNGQQLIVGEVLQGGKQLLTVGLITGAGRFGQLADGFNAVEDVLPQCVFDGISKHFAEHTDITTQRGILFVHKNPVTPSFLFMPRRKSSGHYFVISLYKAT
ncbi:Uncharacterised protein [Enterobacter hormaechei]|nr:Uncharacterised protein [Enterobacter hormaechei]SAA71279.1 Uncharacterised protein [Enterobacter hormaechei]SAH82275.1 Uncharacterised protein [Enterobacter hormaechei]SAH88691.1 Uncharacterised protein [Enterobacter hormaechei]